MIVDLKNSYKKVIWDLSSEIASIDDFGKEGENGKGFKIQIVQNSVAITPTNEELRMWFRKADGHSAYIDSTEKIGDCFIIKCTNQVYSYPGKVEAELHLNVNGEWRKSNTFEFMAYKSLVDGSEKSSNEFIAFQNALDRISQSVTDANNVVVAANKAIDDINMVIETSGSVIDNVNNAASNATDKAEKADAAADKANTAADNLTSVIEAVSSAGDMASKAASEAQTVITNTNLSADRAGSAASTAETMASKASVAADESHAVATQLKNETLKIHKDAVENYSDLEIVYPNPENGWTVTVNNENPPVSYRYNGFASTWVNLGYISTVDVATETTPGIVKGGGNVIIGEDGTLSVPDRTTFEKAGGTATEITLTDIALQDGISKTFIALYSDTATAKTINDKPWYKPGTTTSPPTTAGKAYTVWYDLSCDCFFIKASAGGGTATKADVLATATFSSDTVDEESGTIPIKSAATYTPGTTDKIIAAGQFLGGDQIVKGDANLIPGNISTGIKIFGVSGTLDNTVITGQTTAQGVCAEEITKGNLVTTRRHLGSDTPIALANPDILPTGNGYGVAFITFTSMGMYKYMVVVHYTSPYITIYKQSGDTFTKVDNPTTLPTSTCNSVAVDPKLNHMAVTQFNSPPIMIYYYDINTDTLTKLPNPTSLPVVGRSVAFSPNGLYMVVSHDVSPYITIYKFISFYNVTKLPNPTTLPAGDGRGVAFSPDGVYMVVSHLTSPYITIYKRDGDTFTKVDNPTTLPTSDGRGVAFSPDGTYMAVALGASPYIIIYKRSGDTFTKLPNPTTLPTGIGLSVAFSPDGTYMVVGHYTSPYITIYKRSGDTFTKVNNPTTLPAGAGSGVSFSPDGVYMGVSHDTSPFITIYKADLQVDYLYKYISLTDFNNSNYINFGFAKSNGTVDSAIDITTIPIK